MLNLNGKKQFLRSLCGPQRSLCGLNGESYTTARVVMPQIWAKKHPVSPFQRSLCGHLYIFTKGSLFLGRGDLVEVA